MVDPKQWRFLAGARVAAARTGDHPRAREMSAALEALTIPYLRGENTYGRAQIAAALGERDEAVLLLQQTLGEGVPYYFGVHFLRGTHLDDADPLLQSLNGYPPFEQLLRQRTELDGASFGDSLLGRPAHPIMLRRPLEAANPNECQLVGARG